MTRRILSMVLAVLLLCFLLCPGAVAAPNAEENKQEIYTYLTTEMKCSPAIACGIMANIQALSGYDPEALRKEPRYVSSTEKVATAYGLCQWMGDRWTSLRLFDKEPDTVDAQIRFLHYELLTSEAKAWAEVESQPNTSEGAYTTAVLFAKDYVRITKYYEGVDQFSKIGDISQALFAEFTGEAPATPVTPDTSTGGDSDTYLVGSFLRLPATETYTNGMFVDVSSKAWYNSGVAGAVQFGLMKGEDARIFAPSGNVTVAQAVTMAARLNCIYTNGEDNIQQVRGKEWYKAYVDYAVANGVIPSSYRDKSKSEMNKWASRSEVAAIIAKAMPAEALAARNTVSDNAIPDVKISASYGPAVYQLYRAGVLNGGGTRGEFYPWNSITRAEIATIMTRMADTSNRVSFTMK